MCILYILGAETKGNAPEQSTTKSFIEQITNPNQNSIPGSENCCSCSATRPKPDIQTEGLEVQAEVDVVNAIVDKVLVPK